MNPSELNLQDKWVGKSVVCSCGYVENALLGLWKAEAKHCDGMEHPPQSVMVWTRIGHTASYCIHTSSRRNVFLRSRKKLKRFIGFFFSDRFWYRCGRSVQNSRTRTLFSTLACLAAAAIITLSLSRSRAARNTAGTWEKECRRRILARLCGAGFTLYPANVDDTGSVCYGKGGAVRGFFAVEHLAPSPLKDRWVLPARHSQTLF